MAHKVRILKVTRVDGTVEYISQFRVFFKWFNFNYGKIDFGAFLIVIWETMFADREEPTPRGVWIKSDNRSVASTYTEAHALINEYLQACENYYVSKHGKKIASKEVLRVTRGV